MSDFNLFKYKFITIFISVSIISFAFKERDAEVDENGNFIVKYYAAHYILLFFAILLFGLAISNFLGRLPTELSATFPLLLPGALLVSLFCPVIWRYKVTLLENEIVVRGILPLQATHQLSDFIGIEMEGRRYVLLFNNGKRIPLYKGASGRPHFVEQLRARASLTTQSR